MSAHPIDKTRRQQALLTVLREEPIETQEALRKALRRKGFPVTQATLSRDLKEMRIPSVPTEIGYRYLAPEGAGGQTSSVEGAPKKLRSVASLEVTGIDGNETCVIVRTLTGRAQGVGVYIDAQRLPDVMATLAGDDTILVVPRSIKRTAHARKALANLFGLD